MSDRGQLSAPGSLQNSTGIARVRTPLPAEPLAKLAADNGLKPSAQRPGLIEYLGQLWQRRHFIVAYATARNVSMYTDARLGQVWQVLTPLLNCAVYYLIFGILFKAQRGVDHYIAFLVIGVFIFTFTERSLLVGSRYWFLVIPALLLQTLFNIGACLFIARIGAQLTDVSQLVPFLNRVWRYFCGVMYSIATLPTMLPFWSKAVLQFNPAAVYISLMRFALMQTQRTYAPGAQPYDAMKCARFNTTKNYLLQPYCRPEITTSELWLAGAGWAIFAIVVGLVYFWRAETRYGRG
jgi:teichoic acid transport system permease protein